MERTSRAATSDAPNAELAQPTETRAQDAASSRRRWRRRLVRGLGLVVVVFAAATLGFLVCPSTSLPRHVDGILSLNGGDEGAREALAVLLAKEGYARVLLFSQGRWQ